MVHACMHTFRALPLLLPTLTLPAAAALVGDTADSRLAWKLRCRYRRAPRAACDTASLPNPSIHLSLAGRTDGRMDGWMQHPQV
ncbi:hypothetical protein HYPSUDRAFT_40925 [Hypholoma sublateritium FD-334 SS-4]|uniref:Secreted protein n=1 Tax=Hypholoma sublateritium (strain FD-334 SS-4) TaxID=945553 RepID=A0A0D2L6F6_HYPSF|nr:hypothetical protein HYPSUDRAFT_40925 [Hypholoma sublateritium FD-334 SS-4]